jgi:bacillaene synthase trans-acting acyltransferase
VFGAAMDRCDAAAGLIGGRRISEIIYEQPMSDSDRFDHQHESTAALLAVGYSLARVLFSRGVRPDLLLGYSLGETIAATVAGHLSLEEAFELLAEHADLYQASLRRACLVAVLEPHEILRQMPRLKASCELAAINAPRHFVLAVAAEDLPAATRDLDRHAAIWAMLPVRYGFHASFIDPAEHGFHTWQLPRRTASLPVISCATGAPIADFDTQHLWRAARAPVMFQATVRNLAAQAPIRFVEAGPSGTLAAFVTQNRLPDTRALPAINQFGQDLKTVERVEAAFH